jgi:CubicO group peptidase (beta-lactamase class C family)
MRFALLSVVVVVACGGTAKPSEPQKAKVGDLGVDIPNLSAQLPPLIDSVGAGDPLRAFSGYLLVAQHDQIVWRGAYGLADRGKQRVPTADTSFRIGSVTKQFTATAILRLEQDGKLKVTDKVSQHLPSYRGPAKDVTIHQLLTHTAGIPNYTADPANLARKAEKLTPAQLIAMFEDKPLEFPPGTKFSYSNSGYVVLGAIIERVSGRSYAAYLDQAIFKPAGLAHTVVGDDPGAPDRAEGYQIADGKIAPADPIDLSMPYAAGAIRSTAMDLVKWHRVLSGDTILDAAHRAKLYQPALDHYAYAWVAQPIRDRPTVWHNGGIDGFGTIYWRVPDADLVVVGWTNVLGVNIDQVGKAAVEAALGGKLEPIKKLEKGAVDPAIVARLSGVFELSAEMKAKLSKLPQELVDSITTLEITPTNTGVRIKPNGQSEVELSPLADGSFFNPDHQIKLVFETAAPGPIASVRLEQGPLKITYQRKP